MSGIKSREEREDIMTKEDFINAVKAFKMLRQWVNEEKDLKEKQKLELTKKASGN